MTGTVLRAARGVSQGDCQPLETVKRSLPTKEDVEGGERFWVKTRSKRVERGPERKFRSRFRKTIDKLVDPRIRHLREGGFGRGRKGQHYHENRESTVGEK